MVRLRLLTVTCMLVAAVAIPGSVAGAKPTMEFIPINDVGILDEGLSDLCGFDVRIDASGHIIARTFTDNDGNFVMDVNNYGVHIRYYSAWGHVDVVDTGADRVIDNGDGTQTLHIIGNAQSIVAPGKGRVWANTGMVVVTISFDENGDPTFEFQYQVGQHSEADAGLILCELLAP